VVVIIFLNRPQGTISVVRIRTCRYGNIALLPSLIMVLIKHCNKNLNDILKDDLVFQQRYLAMPTSYFTKNRFLATIFCAFVILTAAGWFFTGSLVEMATRTVKEDVHDANLIISLNLINELKKIQNAAVAVAGSPLTLPVLQKNIPDNLEKANNILDRYHKSLDAAACYLINADGITLASSNRNAKDSFVGQNYTFRPYFQQAMKGDVSQHFAFGTVSKKRGIFASAPVKDKEGNIVGVVVIKKEVEDIEASLKQYIWFLVDQNGIIFMSSQPDVRLKSLWPLDHQLQQKIISSKQYGPGPFPPLMPRQFKRGENVSFKGERYLAEQIATPYEGVSVVLLWSTEQISNYRLFGIILTLLTILLTLSFLTAIYVFRRSNIQMKQLLQESQSQAAALVESQRQLQSRTDELESQKKALEQGREALEKTEEKNRLILGSMQEGIWGLDTEGNTTFVNRAALDMLGYTEEEVIGKSMHALVHYAYPDGSSYPRENCHMYKTFVDGTVRTIEDEVLWRKDGSSFPMEYTTTPILKNGSLIGAVVTFHDITQRKEAEEKVNAYFNSSADGLLILSPERGFIHANQTAAAMFGFQSITDLVKCGPVELSPPYQSDGRPSPEAALEYITKAMQMDKPLRFDWIHRRQDKTDFPCEITLFKLHLAGAPNLLTSIHDITERKKAEEAIHVMAQRYHMILSSQYSGILVVTEEGKIEFANQIFCEQFGLPEAPAELIGLTADEMLKKIMKAYVNPTEAISRIREIVSQGQTIIGEEISMSNGHIYLRDYQPILIDGKNSGRMWQHRDITESKKIEKAILEAKNKTDAILQASTNGIVTINEKGIIETFNPAAERIFGYSWDEISGKNVSLLMPEEHADKHNMYIDNYLQTGIKKVIGKRVEVTAKRKNGELFPAEIGISEVFLKEAKLFTAIINDITERRRAEKELKERMEELERFSRLTINREEKMIQLKEEVNNLLEKTGQEKKYKIVE